MRNMIYTNDPIQQKEFTITLTPEKLEKAIVASSGGYCQMTITDAVNCLEYLDSTIHPARQIPFAELRAGLSKAKEERLVNEHESYDGLLLYCYTQNCVYDKGWNDITRLARGLIIDPKNERVVATPFPKFFNIGEYMDATPKEGLFGTRSNTGRTSIPDLPFEVFEKLDGSLIILFWADNKWRSVTKGSFQSTQSYWAARWLSTQNLDSLDRGTTYLAEAIYPENRIVVRYDDAGLVLLGAYDLNGVEMSYDALCETAKILDWKVAKRYSYTSISDLIVHAQTLPANEEGYVLRFSNGLRLKIKGDEYCRIHAMISRVTPLALWEAMKAGDDLGAIRKLLPEEFWNDFDKIVNVLTNQLESLVSKVKEVAQRVAHMSNKELGLALGALVVPDELRDINFAVRSFLFAYRNNHGELLSGRTREAVFRSFRPTSNVLVDYEPSYAMSRVLDAE